MDGGRGASVLNRPRLCRALRVLQEAFGGRAEAAQDEQGRHHHGARHEGGAGVEDLRPHHSVKGSHGPVQWPAQEVIYHQVGFSPVVPVL